MNLVFLTQVSFSLIQFLIIFIILHNDGIEMVGYYGLITAIINPFQQLFKSGIPKLISTSKNKFETMEYFKLGIFSSVLFIILGLLTTNLIYSYDNIILFSLILIQKSLLNLRDNIHAIYLRNELFKKFFFSGFIFNILMLITFYLVYKYSGSIIYAFSSFISILILVNTIDIIINNQFLSIRSIPCKKLIKTFELSITDGIYSLKSSMPRYLIANIFDIYLLGVYTSIFQAVSALEIVNQSIIKYNYKKLTVSFYRKISDFKKVVNTIYFQIFIITFFSILINLFFGEELIYYFLDNEIVEFYWVLILLIIARSFSMINAIPKIIFILSNKIKLNTLNTFCNTAVAFFILYFTKSFYAFIIILVITEITLFFTNVIILKKSLNNKK